MSQWDLSQLPSCHVQVVHPRPADARTSSWHRHAPSPENQEPSMYLPHPNARKRSMKTLSHRVRWSFFVQSDSSPTLPRPSSPINTSIMQEMRHSMITSTNHSTRDNPNNANILTTLSQKASHITARKQSPSRNLAANRTAKYRKGSAPSNSAVAERGGYLKSAKSSLRQATDDVSFGLQVSPCPHFPNTYASTCNDWHQCQNVETS